MAMMNLKCRIVEGDVDGWDVYFPTYGATHVASASAALAHVTSLVKALPESSVLEIGWEPRTVIGRSVVKVITS